MNLPKYKTQDLHSPDAQEIMHKSKMCIFCLNLTLSV